MQDSDPKALYGYLIPELSKRKLAYVHLIAARQFEATPADDPKQLAPLRKLFAGPAILAGGFDRATGAAALAAGEGDAIAYGRFYLSNPDLPKRYALNAELNAYDRDTFYNPQARTWGRRRAWGGGVVGAVAFSRPSAVTGDTQAAHERPADARSPRRAVPHQGLHRL